MKTLLPILLILTVFTATAGQTTGLALGYRSQLALQTPGIKTTRSLAFKPVAAALPEYNKDKCRHYRSMLIGGAVTFGLGMGMLTTGITIFGLNAAGEANGNNGLSQEMLIGGGIMLGVGAVATITGIPFLAIGAKKTKRYCGNTESMNLQFIKHGNMVGLALRF